MGEINIVKTAEYETEYKQACEKVKNIFREFSASPHLMGYGYLIKMCASYYVKMRHLAIGEKVLLADIYYDIGAIETIQYNRVERAARHAVEVIFNDTELDTLEKYFAYNYSAKRGRPTLSEFVASIAYWLAEQEDSV